MYWPRDFLKPKRARNISFGYDADTYNYLEEPDEDIPRALLHVYAKHGALPDARKCFDFSRGVEGSG